MSKKIIVHSQEIVNEGTGEVTTTHKSVTISTKSSDEFFMVFVKFISGFFELTSALDMKVLIKFCQMADFNSGVVLIPASVRKSLLESLGIKSSHFSNSINRLKKANLITGEQGRYELNPIVVWKGDIKTRDEIIRRKGLDFRINFTGKDFEG